MVSINTNSLKHISLYEALDFIVNNLKCNNIELTTDGKAHAYDYVMGTAKTSYLPFTNVKYVALGGGWVDFVRNDILLVERQCEVCRSFGMNKIRFFLCNPHDEASVNFYNFREAMKNLRIVADAYKDIIFMIENHGGFTADSVGVNLLMEAVERPNVGLVFDPANFIKCGEDPLIALDLLYPYIRHVHVKDICGKHFCSVGEGFTPWYDIVSRLHNKGYDGYFSVEYEGEEDKYQGLINSYYNFLNIYKRFY